MENKLSINFTQLSSAITDYTKAYEELNAALGSVDKAMGELRSSKWDTEASVAYFAQYSEEWRISVRNHLAALNELREQLEYAQKEYGAVYDQIEVLANTLNI